MSRSPVMRGPGTACSMLALWVGSMAGSAMASDGNLPRTPMLHRDAACLVVVDRTVDPVVHLDYTIPFSDTCVGPHEPAGSRTHRYVALCRPAEPWETLPHWLDPSDIEASITAGVLAEHERPADGDVLTRAPAWSACHALVGDLAHRNPIHCAHALEGIDWDTRELAAGTWVLTGYTYHPPMNMWTMRPGVFKIVDGTGDDPPAVGLHPHAAYAGDDRPLEVRVCVDAQAGSTVHVAAAVPGAGPAPWIELASATVDEGDEDIELALDLGAAFDAATPVTLRAEVREPLGRTFAYLSPDPVTYVAGPTPADPSVPADDYCEDDAALDPQTCPPTDTSSGDEDAGCSGCTLGRSPLDAIAWFVFLFAAYPTSRPRSRMRRT